MGPAGPAGPDSAHRIRQAQTAVAVEQVVVVVLAAGTRVGCWRLWCGTGGRAPWRVTRPGVNWDQQPWQPKAGTRHYRVSGEGTSGAAGLGGVGGAARAGVPGVSIGASGRAAAAGSAAPEVPGSAGGRHRRLPVAARAPPAGPVGEALVVGPGGKAAPGRKARQAEQRHHRASEPGSKGSFPAVSAGPVAPAPDNSAVANTLGGQGWGRGSSGTSGAAGWPEGTRKSVRAAGAAGDSSNEVAPGSRWQPPGFRIGAGGEP